jgi:methyl coenzyme M reductase subunit D
VDLGACPGRICFGPAGGAHQLYLHPDRRRVTVSFHRPGETFEIKTLRTMIETQARWTDEDLRRLKFI